MAMDNAEEMAENRQFNEVSRSQVGRSEFVIMEQLYGMASLLQPIVFSLRDGKPGKSKGGKGSKNSGKGNKDKCWNAW